VLVVGIGFDDDGVEVVGVGLIVVGVGEVTVPDPDPELEEDAVVEESEPLEPLEPPEPLEAVPLGVELADVLEPLGDAVLVGAPPVAVGELEDGSLPAGCRTVGSVCV
jgi:hypothetical protein